MTRRRLSESTADTNRRCAQHLLRRALCLPATGLPGWLWADLGQSLDMACRTMALSTYCSMLTIFPALSRYKCAKVARIALPVALYRLEGRLRVPTRARNTARVRHVRPERDGADPRRFLRQ